MRTIKKLDVWSFVVYGAVLVAFWTLAFGIFYWITGWIFGAQSWFIDMNLANWSGYTIRSIFGVIVAMFINGIGGAGQCRCPQRHHIDACQAALQTLDIPGKHFIVSH